MVDYRLRTLVRVYYIKNAWTTKPKIIPLKYSRQFTDGDKVKAYFDLPNQNDAICIVGVDVLNYDIKKDPVWASGISNRPRPARSARQQ